jgi:hypothetical protein
MALKILEGLDRTGKSSVAQFYKDNGYEVIHMSAPAKGISKDEYMGEMVDLLSSLAGKDVVLDRSAWGEKIWPLVYGREPLLNDDDFEIISELEDSIGVERILMHDPNSEAHWKRCVDNKEPLTKVQFIKARTLYSAMADKYGFQRKTLNDFPEAKALTAQVAPQSSATNSVVPTTGVEQAAPAAREADNRTPQQIKLDKANAINEVLEKRIIKGKGPMYDELERSVRGYLNIELGKIFGNNTTQVQTFSQEEVDLLKFFCGKLKEKGAN